MQLEAVQCYFNHHVYNEDTNELVGCTGLFWGFYVTLTIFSHISTWIVGCGLTSHSAIFQLYCDGTIVQFPNLDLLPDTQCHGQQGVFSLPWHGHRKAHMLWGPVCQESNPDFPIPSPVSTPPQRAIPTWKQKILNLWNRSGESWVQTLEPLLHKPRA